MAENEDEAARRAAMDAIRSWARPDDLYRFTQERHGYGNSDGMCGVTYPGDLDDSDRENGFDIPEGFVEVYAWYGAGDGPTYLMEEKVYWAILSQWLSEKGREDLARQLSPA